MERFGVSLLSAVRKIEPADVDAGIDELLDRLFAATGRTDRGDDLCVAHVRDSLHRNEPRRTISAMYKVFEDALITNGEP